MVCWIAINCDKKPQKVPLVYFVWVQIPYQMYEHPTKYPTFYPRANFTWARNDLNSYCTQWGWGIDWSTLTEICNQIDRFTPRLSDMIGTIYRLKYLWSIKLMFCESKSRPRCGLDLTCRVESVSHSNCVTIQKGHVLFGALWEY